MPTQRSHALALSARMKSCVHALQACIFNVSPNLLAIIFMPFYASLIIIILLFIRPEHANVLATTELKFKNLKRIRT